MATISMMVRVAANTAELKRALAEGRNEIVTTTSALDKLTRNLSGERLIQSAHNYAAAVNKIGGAAKLTATEKERVNAVLTRAIEKYNALGKAAPTAMLQLADATKRVEQPTGLVTTKMIALGSAIGASIGNIATNAVMSLVTGMGDMLVQGAKTIPLTQSFHRLAESIGESGDTMLNVTRSATKGLISDLNIMQASNKAMLLGLPVTSQEMATLAKSAVALGKAMGQDATKSLDDLITALGRSSPMILDNLGLTVKVGEANEAYARKLGKSADALTDAEKKTAFYNAAVAAAQMKTALLGDSALTAAEHVDRLRVAWENLVTAVGRNAATVLGVVATALTTAPNRPQIGLGDAKAGGVSTEPPAARIARELREQIEAMRELTGPTLQTGAAFSALSAEWALEVGLLDDLTKRIKDNIKAQEELKKIAKEMPQVVAEQFRSLMAVSGAVIPGGLPRLLQQENALGPVSPGMLFGPGRGLPQVVPGGLTDGMRRENLLGQLAPSAGRGGFLGGLTSGVGNIFKGLTGGQGVGGFLSNIGGGIAQGFGNLISGGISSLIGTGVNLAIKGLGKLFGFGPSQAEQTAKARNQFLEQVGGVEKFREAAERAGVSVDRVFSARKPKDFEAAVKSVTRAIEEQEARQKRLDDVAQRYGLTIDQYGRKFRQARLNDQIQAVIEDYRDLLEITENVTLATEKIAPAVTQYLHAALRTGAEVPIGLKPILQRMIELGLLYDAAGNKVTDLGELNITWSETMTQGFSRVVEAVNRLTDALTGAAKAADSIHVPPVPGLPEPSVPEVPQIHTGGMIWRRAHNGFFVGTRLAVDEVPIIAQTGEGVLSRRGMAALGGPGMLDSLNRGRGAPPSAVVDLEAVRRELRGMRGDLNRVFDILPGQVTAAAQIARGRRSA